MNDKDIFRMLEKYKKKELEIESNYNIKKEELEKEHRTQQIDNKFKFLNVLSQKIEEAKTKYEALIELKNALFGNDENEIMKEMIKETKETVENDINSQGIHLREETEINGMINTTNFIEGKEQEDESEGKEGKEQKEEKEEKGKKEKKDLKMTNKKKNRSLEKDNN